MGSGGTGDGRNTGGAAGSDAGFRCTPGSDQTCNDDPAISSLWGRCNSDGVCSCGPGFAVGASGRCQLDTSCRGPGVSMTWPATVQLDTSGCAARTATDCAAGGVGAPSAILDVQLLIFAQQACHLPSHTFVMVDFVSGCPSDLRVGDSLGRADGTLVDCLSREAIDQRPIGSPQAVSDPKVAGTTRYEIDHDERVARKMACLLGEDEQLHVEDGARRSDPARGAIGSRPRRATARVELNGRGPGHRDAGAPTAGIELATPRRADREARPA